MFAPNISTHQLADQIHQERIDHSALLHKVARDRSSESAGIDRQALRRTTSRRLAATFAAAVLSIGIAAVAAAQGPSDVPSAGTTGGTVTLIR